jgi:hypothetical protein
MADQDYFEKDWKDAELYWSLIKYTRAWWATDGARLDVLRAYQGLNTHLIRSITDEYNVVRSLPGGYDILDENSGDESKIKEKVKFTEEHDPVAEKIRAVIAEHLVKWGGDLNTKAEICITICNQLREIDVAPPNGVFPFRNNALSATSKLVWFLRPAKWTMYDRFACTGLFGKDKTTNEENFRAFYSELQRLNFLEYEEKLELSCKDTIFEGVPASRILDTLLMERAPEKAEISGAAYGRRMMYMRGSLNTLPASVSADLKAAATQIHDAVYKENMLRIDTGVKP